MTRSRLLIVNLLWFGVAIWTGVSAADLTVLPPATGDHAYSMMMHRYLMREFDAERQRWKTAYQQRKTPERIAANQSHLRSRFIEAIGGLPERTPLNARVTGVVLREGFTVEKVIFESMPGVYVTGALFLPREGRFTQPYPGVLVPCGHTFNGKADAKYQKAAALLALNGMAAFVFDPIDQGERIQLVDEHGRYPLWGTRGHQMLGVGSILLGRNTARFEIWDGMRAIDYLQSRPEVDPMRLGCMGNSGGGTQTAYLMALDDRIIVASPSCYITSFDRLLRTIGGQDAEQNIFGQLSFGMDQADYLMMRAPVPILISAATRDFFDIRGTWDSFRYAKRVYSRLGFSERIDLIEHDAPHGYHRPQREAAARWMLRWLKGEDRPINEPQIDVLTDDEIRCTPRGQVMFLEGARSVYAVNQAYELKLAKMRKRYWSSLRDNGQKEQARRRVRQIIAMRAVDELPPTDVETVEILERDGYQIEKLNIHPEQGIVLPGLLYRPKKLGEDDPPRLFLSVNDAGKTGEEPMTEYLTRLVRKGAVALAVDVRGIGETKQNNAVLYHELFGRDGQDVVIAYLLGRNYVAMRAEDMIVCGRYLLERFEHNQGLVLLSCGHMVGVSALHAAALAPGVFDRAIIRHSLRSWADVVHTPMTKNQLVTAVHGALKFYDLPDLTRMMGERLVVEKPVGADGRALRQQTNAPGMRGVETLQVEMERIGIEPTTSALQRPRSPN